MLNIQEKLSSESIFGIWTETNIDYFTQDGLTILKTKLGGAKHPNRNIKIFTHSFYIPAQNPADV